MAGSEENERENQGETHGTGVQRSADTALRPAYVPPVSDSAPVISYQAELGRKALHLGALVIPLGLLLLDDLAVLGLPLSVVILAPLAALALALDVARVHSASIREFLHRWFVWLMRPEEVPPLGGPVTFNGATMMCTSAAICAALFPAGIAAAALAMLMVGDGAAAIIGRQLGRHRWPGSPKSVEGSLAYAVTAFGIGLAVVAWPGSGLNVAVCAVGALTGAIVEALPIPVNDNLRVPLLTGLAMVAAPSMGL